MLRSQQRQQHARRWERCEDRAVPETGTPARRLPASPGASLESDGSADGNAWHSQPLWLSTSSTFPPAGQHRNQPGWFNRYQGIRDCSWELGHTCPNGAALIQSETKPTDQGQPQRLQLAGNPSGEVQVLGRKKRFLHSFFNILNIYVYIKKTFLESEVTRAYSNREKGKEDFHRPCPCHHTFLFISDKRDSTPPTYHECKQSQTALCPRWEAETGDKEVEMPVSGYLSSFKGSSWRPSQKDPAVIP